MIYSQGGWVSHCEIINSDIQCFDFECGIYFMKDKKCEEQVKIKKNKKAVSQV